MVFILSFLIFFIEARKSEMATKGSVECLKWFNSQIFSSKISYSVDLISVGHSREGWNPGAFKLDSPSTSLRTVSLSNGRLRGSDNHFVTYLEDSTLKAILKIGFCFK